MNRIKGNSVNLYWFLIVLLAIGMVLAANPVSAAGRVSQTSFDTQVVETPPPGAGELQEYQAEEAPDAGVLETGIPEPAGQPVCNPDIPDMVAYWPLDDSDTPVNNKLTFKNYMGTNNGSCTIPGCPTKSTGKVSGSYTFIPSNDPYTDNPDIITVPYFTDLDWGLNDSFTFETWVKIPKGADCTGNQVFIGRRGIGTYSIWLGCSTTNKAKFSVRDSDLFQTVVESNKLINDGAWHHIVGVRDAPGSKLFLYVDGLLEKSANTAFQNGFDSASNLSLGYFITPAPPYYYLNGTLDEVALYSRALTLANVQFHYNGGAGKSYCNAGPVVTDPGDQTNKEGDSVSLQIQASDQDPGSLNFSATGLPVGLSINKFSGLITGKIGCDASTGSPYTVTVTAKNTTSNKAGNAKFTWTVTNSTKCVTKYPNYMPVVVQEP